MPLVFLLFVAIYKIHQVTSIVSSQLVLMVIPNGVLAPNSRPDTLVILFLRMGIFASVMSAISDSSLFTACKRTSVCQASFVLIPQRPRANEPVVPAKDEGTEIRQQLFADLFPSFRRNLLIQGAS